MKGIFNNLCFKKKDDSCKFDLRVKNDDVLKPIFTRTIRGSRRLTCFLTSFINNSTDPVIVEKLNVASLATILFYYLSFAVSLLYLM